MINLLYYKKLFQKKKKLFHNFLKLIYLMNGWKIPNYLINKLKIF